jgi:DNA-binding transcriptional LysR family regulator
VLPGAVRAIRGSRPQIHIALYNMTPGEQFEGLRQRSLDIALVCEPPPTTTPICVPSRCWTTPCCWPSRRAPAGQQGRTGPADLHEQEWIITGGQPDQVNKRDDFIARCGDAGFTPRLSLEATDPLSVLGLGVRRPGPGHGAEQPDGQCGPYRGVAPAGLVQAQRAAMGGLAPGRPAADRGYFP